MNVEVFLTANHVTEEEVRRRTVVVIDVFRMSATVATALQNGARSVVPVADMAEAGKIAANMDARSYLMGGERGGIPIQGYHLGNSPFEYTREVVQGRTIILNTTNGTPAVTYARGARHLLVGSFVNASRLVAFIEAAGLDVALVCAGWRNRVALEDTLCAGLLLHMLWNSQAPSVISDSAHIAFSQYLQDRGRLEEALHQCNHAQRLRRMHREADIDYCLKIDSLPLLPYYQDNRLVLYKEEIVKTQVAAPA